MTEVGDRPASRAPVTAVPADAWDRVGPLLTSIGAVARAARTGTCDDVYGALGDCLADLATAVGASRSCLCVVDDDIVTGFVSGGSEDVVALGPALLGRRIADIPEWRAAFESPDRRSIVFSADPTSPVLGAILDSAHLDWLLTDALSDDRDRIATLSLLGRGDAVDLDDLQLRTLDQIAEVLTTTLLLGRQRDAARPAPRPAPDRLSSNHPIRLALDLLDIGVVWFDTDGHPVVLNAVAERHLGTRLVSGSDGSPSLDPPLTVEVVGETGPAGERRVRVTTGRGEQAHGTITVHELSPDAAGASRVDVLVLDPAPRPTGPGPTERTPILGTPARSAAGQLVEAKLGRVPTMLGRLTDREMEVVELLLEGHRVATIAAELYLSPHTVRNRLKSIFRKTGTSSQAELVHLARRAWQADATRPGSRAD